MKQVKIYNAAWDPNESALWRNAVLGPDYRLKPLEGGYQMAEVGDYCLTVRMRLGQAGSGCSPGEVDACEYVTQNVETGDITPVSLSAIREHEVVATGLALNPKLKELLNLA